MNDKEIEQKIQDKGLNAPRLTPSDIDNAVSSIWYINGADCIPDNYQPPVPANHPLSLLTFCVIVLKNGFTVTGESACVSPENFNAEIGKEIAFKNAWDKIWALEGYLLKQKLFEESQSSDTQAP